MNPTDRILKQRDLHAMVALDTFDAIAERVRNLLAHGRRMTVTERYTYVDSPPKVTAGLTVDRFDPWGSEHGKGLTVRLKPGILNEFGIVAHAGENDSEKQEWARFHAGKSVSDDPFQRRQDMTEVTINGGLPGDGPSRDDLLVIREWNRDGVCIEKVVAFDYGPDRQQIREDVAKHLWVADGADPETWDKLADAAWSLAGYNRRTGHTLNLDGAEQREKFLTAADQVLAIAWRD